MSNSIEHMNVADLENAIHMLNEHVTETSVKALIPILEALKQDLDNESLLAQLTDTWRNLGIYQGTVLTYVPYFFTFIADDIFGDDKV